MVKTTPSEATAVRVGLVSLGCAKNLVDAEVMLGTLMREGVEITNDAAAADVIIVNTCSFIDAAQEESIDSILESAAVREARNRNQGLIVSGCLPQRFREELPKLLPEVDAFMGIDQVGEVASIVHQALERRARKLSEPRPKRKRKEIAAALAVLEEKKGEGMAEEAASSGPLVKVNARPTYIPDYATPRFRLTPRHFAYVKIAEGCNHPCSFCIIPRMRGTHRSRGQEDIVKEARQLVADGVKELNLISQDSTYYGLDLRKERTGPIASPEKFRQAALALPKSAPTLVSLLRELNALPGEFWIRLLYTHPAHWTDELMEAIAESPKVARYVDMPLQHIHANMLERMRRETSREHIVELIGKLRRKIPGIALRTTFIVGFPGETESYFESLVQFVEETKFERLGVFMYSHEEGTRAGQMKHQIPEAIKIERRERLMAAQAKVAEEISRSFVGREIKVLVEKEADFKGTNGAEVNSWEHGLIREGETGLKGMKAAGRRYLAARGEWDAPDIDGRVYIRGKAPLGEFSRVKVIGHGRYDLVAEPAGAEANLRAGVEHDGRMTRLR